MAYVNACCPQQAIDEFTPDAWHDLLADYDLGECRAAVIQVARRQPFVAPCEIIAEADRARYIEASRVRREQLDRDMPALALASGDGIDRRLPREEIDAILASVTAATGVTMRLPSPPRARQSAAELEAERRRQIAALDELMKATP